MSSLRWTAKDTWTLAVRDLLHWRYEPARIAWTLAFPVMSILLFGYVFGSAIVVPGASSDDYREYLMPGLFVMSAAFGISESLFGIAMDSERGITSRLRAMPMSRAAILGGGCVAAMINAVITFAVMIAMGLAVGWSWHEGLAKAGAAVLLLLLLRFAVLWIGIWIGLAITSIESAGNISGLLFPFTMISSVFVSPSQMPDWLGTIAAWNPLSSTVNATRELFGNGDPVGTSWIETHAILMAVVWPLVIVAVFAPLAIRRYQKMSK
ncbi:MAG TPA: ABC transporter permease [Conexibacter sp.]|nr:ABC transporter permease [Conexibacter sp.]